MYCGVTNDGVYVNSNMTYGDMSLSHGDIIKLEVKKLDQSNYSVTFTKNEALSYVAMISSPTPVYLLGAVRKINNNLEILSAKLL